MPTYEYACSKCDEHFEVYQSFSDEPLKKHDGCGGKLSKVFGSVGIVLKGSGFYKNDNGSRSKSTTRSTAAEGSGDNTSSDPASGKATDKKPDKKSDSGSATSTKKSGSSDSKSGSGSSKNSSKAGAGT